MNTDSPVDLQNGVAEYGRRLLPTVLDERAAREPETIICSLPYDDADLTKGYEDITVLRFANSVNRLAWFIHENLGQSQQFDTIAYMGVPDIRYQILQIAVVKTGYKVLFSSHLNSLTGHLSLLDKTNAKIMLSASSVKVGDILAERQMKHKIIPELDDLLNSSPVENYPYHKSFADAKDDPFFIIHTSGTTGTPKPVQYTLGTAATLDYRPHLPDTDPVSGFPIRSIFAPGDPGRMLVPLLPFHSTVSTATMIGMIYHGLIWIPGFRHKMTCTNDIFAILENCKADVAFFSPAMVEDLAQQPDIGRYLSGLKYCLYAGAAITDTAGEVFAKYTHLQSQWGTTELIKVVDLQIDPEDFAYNGFELKHSGLTFEPVGDGLFEMVFRRTPDSYDNMPFFWRCPEEEVFRPGDLWSPHPDPRKAKHVWKYQGRIDDLINWAEGTNFNPTDYESKYSEHDDIRAAVMAGTGHRQPVLLLELCTSLMDDVNVEAVLDKIWKESVTRVNDLAPTSAQVAKTHIVIAAPDKPFQRSVKGTVARRAILRQYESEIESTYQKFGDKSITPNERFADG